MAERRMFAKTIIDSDAFLDMPVTARLLYYDLAMRADDDGFINSPKKIMRMVGASPDDLSILALRKFIIPFENGVVVIKHWRIHNYIRKDTYSSTPYLDEKRRLILDENKAYTLADDVQSTDCQHHVDEPSTQVRLGKDSLGKDSIGKDIEAPTEPPATAKPVRHRYGEYRNVLLTDDDLDKLKAEFPDWEARIERLSGYIASSGKSYKNHLATIRNWARKDAQQQKTGGSGFNTGNPFLEMLDERRGMR